MSKETSKAMRRRWCEDAGGIFPWRGLFRGRALDVGAGDDPLCVPEGCVAFDQADGDANHLSRYHKAGSFDLIHASQCLEHMHDPGAALRDWLTLLAPGGHLVATVPSWELYEKKRDRSAFNPDHKATFSTLSRTGGAALPHYFVPRDLVSALPEGCWLLNCRLLAENYDFSRGGDFDQTWEETDGVEPWIEFVIRKT